MKITAYTLSFRSAAPLSISFHTFHERKSILLFAEHGGHRGVGEAAPFKPITGDSPEEVIRELEGLEEIPLDPEIDGVEKLHAFLDTRITCQTLRAALDFAYHDLIGKITGLPVYRLYCDVPSYADNSVTVFIQESLDETRREAERIIQSYPHLRLVKIKLKGDGADIRRAEEIKKVSPRHMQFTLDANQAYADPVEAVRDLRSIGSLLEHVLLIEEPCARGDLDKMRFVREHLEGMLVFADESAATLQDVEHVIMHGAADGVNIKLQKAGGLWPGTLIARLARDAGMKIMVGAMIEGALSTAAGAHFACGTEGLVMTDLDMDLDLPDHAEGGAQFRSGMRIPAEKPGLGVTLSMEKIKSLAESGLAIFEQVK
jgi:L-Ala-D/L-Glu epimerase